MRILVILMLSGTLGILGCDSESGGTAGSGGSGGTAGTGGTGGASGGGGQGGEGGAGGMDAAAAFCADYGEICGFDGAGHQSEQECEAAYNGYDADRQDCVETHLALADSTMDTFTHCPHATGEAPCD